MKRVTSCSGLRWRFFIAVMAAALALPVVSAQAQWRGRGWHGGGWGWHGGWHGNWGWRGPGWGWRGPGWGGVSLGFVVPPAYFGWPVYPPPTFYPPPAYYPPPAAYGYYPNAYAPSYYGYASPPVTYPAPQAYAQSGYPAAATDPNNCGTPDEPKACAR